MGRIRYEPWDRMDHYMSLLEGLKFETYQEIDVKTTVEVFNTMKSSIEKVIFNPPATIVYWCDGTKTVVKADETFDPEKGLAMAIAKHHLGNKGNYYNEFKKWLPTEMEKNV